MTFVLWQTGPGEPRRTASVRGERSAGVPARLHILASVSDAADLRGPAAYIQLSVPRVGPVLAWVGVPGGGQRDGHFVHPETGTAWPWGQLKDAVEFALGHAAQRSAG
jgi:hypothetical protein